MPANDPEQARRDLNHWNATRHVWDRFQASSRRAAERIARTAATRPDTAPNAVTDQAGSQHDEENNMDRCPHCFLTDGHHVNCPKFGAAPDINGIGVYDSTAYTDLDRAAAMTLRLPLLVETLSRPAESRRGWLVGLTRGLADGLKQGVEESADAYLIGQRIALLLIEEGHA